MFILGIPSRPSDAGPEPMRCDPNEPPPTWRDYGWYAADQLNDALSHRTDRDMVKDAKLAKIACFEKAIEHLADAIKDLTDEPQLHTCIEVDAGDAAHWTSDWMTFFRHPERVQVDRMRLVKHEPCTECYPEIVGECAVCGGTEYPF